MSVHWVTSEPGILGVLDLQGGVHEHLEHLERLNLPWRRVKTRSDFSYLAGLIIPGGESTCLARLLSIFDLKSAILEHAARGMKIWGTCAGAILVATRVVGESPCLSLLDIEIERNSFGSQLDSFTTEAMIPVVAPDPLPLTFIRAPKILHAGEGVHVLLRMADYIAAAESEGVLATVFHPELTGSLALHRYFAQKCGLNPAQGDVAVEPSKWDNLSWMKLARIASSPPFHIANLK